MLDEMGREELMARWDAARRLIRENGITHNVYDNPDGLGRPWSLDLLPLPVPAAEWDAIGTALAQRARLLDALLADLYGPATCVASGLLPPELVYANPGFLRPCHGMRPPQGQWLHLYAADLVRAPDGQFRVLSDRTQAPSGSRLLARKPHRSHARVVDRVPTVQRVAAGSLLYCAAAKPGLAGAARIARNPRVVLLTPGPYNEAYFEHAYLARYLGYTLVQGKDLTVRDCRVYLKTLSGLQQRGRDLAPRGRRLLRSVGAVLAFISGRAGLAAGGARRHRGRGQRSGQRRAASARVSAVPAGACAGTCWARS